MDLEGISINENDLRPEDLPAVSVLLGQLSSQAREADFLSVEETMRGGTIVTLRDGSDGGRLIGMGTLVFVRKVTVLSGVIEDVVVDEAYRGRGLGKAVLEALVRKSREAGMAFVDLTSKPERVAANGLYAAMGFARRETNAYRLRH